MSKYGPKPCEPHNSSDVGIEWSIYSRLSMRRIPDDEPIFVLRASDPLALQALMVYRQTVMNAHRDVENEHAAATLMKARQFQAFRESHPGRMALPGQPTTTQLEEEESTPA